MGLAHQLQEKGCAHARSLSPFRPPLSLKIRQLHTRRNSAPTHDQDAQRGVAISQLASLSTTKELFFTTPRGTKHAAGVMFRCTSGEGAATTTAATAAAAAAAEAAAAASEGKPDEEDRTELEKLAKLCGHMLVTNLAQAVFAITSFAYAGRLLDRASLAGLGLGISVCNISGV